MSVSIEKAVLEKYPEAEIGYLVAEVSVRQKDPFVEELKESLAKKLEEKGINATNFAAHPSVSSWRKIYQEDFLVKPKNYRSSLEALLRRVVTGKKIGDICNVVDLYNSCSVLSLLPMGGYDLSKINGDIQIRFGREGETFLGLGEKEKVPVKQNHVVYADAEKVLCCLWNHKDAAATCIRESTKDLLFFIDSLAPVQNALDNLAEHLEQIGAVPKKQGVLNRKSPRGEL